MCRVEGTLAGTWRRMVSQQAWVPGTPWNNTWPPDSLVGTGRGLVIPCLEQDVA